MIETSRGGKCESNEWRHTGEPGIVRMWTGGGGIVSTKLSSDGRGTLRLVTGVPE